MRLLTHQSSNAKLGKNADVCPEWETWILYLAPSDIVAGVNLCPAASPGCRSACLFYAGRGQMTSTQEARVKKTELLRDSPDVFMAELVRDLESVARRARRRGIRAAVRLNGTSDVAWERIAVTRRGAEYASVMDAFPDITFYDYTKRVDRVLLVPNYRLTFSRSEINGAVARRMASAGFNVAVVFLDSLPATWEGREVIDGTTHDMRFLDPAGVIVGLVAKGPAARRDTSGFVVRHIEVQQEEISA